jgi:hypothetical protein
MFVMKKFIVVLLMSLVVWSVITAFVSVVYLLTWLISLVAPYAAIALFIGIFLAAYKCYGKYDVN